ncbi:MAG: hypothetical protein OHK0026_09750 [Rhodocyclaceae bacterium]
MKGLGVIAVAAAATVSCVAAAAAAVTLAGEAQLGSVLAKGGYCCVVDARSQAARTRDPIADAVLYRKGVKIVPSAAVVVVADSDALAMKVGEAIALEHGAGKVVAVKGGAAAWRAYAAAVAGAPPASMSFVIPRNTCESGQTLQELSSERK